MKNKKVFRIFNSLSDEEKNLLLKFLVSPFFIKSKAYLKVAKVLGRLQKSPNNWSEEVFFNKVYPGKEYKHGYSRKFLSEFLGLLLDFIKLDYLRKNQSSQNHSLLMFLNERGEHHYFKGFYDEFSTVQIENQDSSWGAFKFFDDFRLELEFHKFNALQADPERSPVFQRALKDVDDFYFITKLDLACKSLSYDRDFGTIHELGFFEEIVSFLRSKDLSRRPLLKAYLKAYKLLRNPERDDFFTDFKKSLLDLMGSVAHLRKMELLDLFMYGINHCVLSFNLKKTEYGVELVGLYQKLLDSGLLLEGGFIGARNFKNIFSTYLFVKQRETAKMFLDDHNKFLKRPEGLAVFHYCFGYLKFLAGDLDEAENRFLLSRNSLNHKDDVELGIQVFAMLMRCYFEKKEFSEGLKLGSQMRKRLTKASLSQEKKKSYRMFLDIFPKIVEVRKERRQEVQKEMAEEVLQLYGLPKGDFFAAKWAYKQLERLFIAE